MTVCRTRSYFHAWRIRLLTCADNCDPQFFVNLTYWTTWLPGSTNIYRVLLTISTIGKFDTFRTNDSSPTWQHSRIVYWIATIFSTLPRLRTRFKVSARAFTGRSQSYASVSSPSFLRFWKSPLRDATLSSRPPPGKEFHSQPTSHCYPKS